MSVNGYVIFTAFYWRFADVDHDAEWCKLAKNVVMAYRQAQVHRQAGNNLQLKYKSMKQKEVSEWEWEWE